MATMTAGDVVARIKSNLGQPWRDTTYRDTFKYGGAGTVVTGIATTVFCTFDVLQRAAAAGLNLVIPHEDTYWNDRDDVAVTGNTDLYRRKTEFMRAHNMAVFRIHDHMHVQQPDFTYVGCARALGLDSKYETAPQAHRFIVPPTTLQALASDFRRRLGAQAIRVVGDPKATVSRIQLGVGYATPNLGGANIDAVVSGEQQESDGNFDSPAYALDAQALGIAKGWIMLGHAVSEEQGMLEMADWIRKFVSEVPVQLVKAGEPFSR
jgi:putative NIF3 family GTP cyclohydrolase 1 type 2